MGSVFCVCFLSMYCSRTGLNHHKGMQIMYVKCCLVKTVGTVCAYWATLVYVDRYGNPPRHTCVKVTVVILCVSVTMLAATSLVCMLNTRCH